MKLTKLRKQVEMLKGSYSSKLIANNNVIAYVRTHTTTGKYVVVALNFGSNVTVNLKTAFTYLPDSLTVYTASLTSGIVEG